LADLRRSFFLHRLRVLGVHFAELLPSRQQGANWGEYWQLRWTPEAEIEIVEAALLYADANFGHPDNHKELMESYNMICTKIKGGGYNRSNSEAVG